MRACAVFIHSTGLGPFMWSKLRPAVPPGIETIAPANVGYPPRPLLERGAPFRVEDDMDAVLAAIPPDAERVHLLGHSYGALIALRLGRDRPPSLRDRIASIWAFEPIVFGALDRARDTLTPDVRAEVEKFFDDPRFLDDRFGGTDAWLEVFIDYWNRPGAWTSMPPAMRETQIALGWKMFSEVRACTHPYSFGDFAGIRAPLTLVRGSASTAATQPMIAGLAEAVPHACVDVLPGLPHMAPLTRAEGVAPSVARHFERVTTG